MTSAATPTYLQTLSEADRAHEIEQWRAAQTVRNRVTDPEWRDELLGALGLLDVQQPVG
jgi:hypothetical protein